MVEKTYFSLDLVFELQPTNIGGKL